MLRSRGRVPSAMNFEYGLGELIGSRVEQLQKEVCFG